MKGQLCDIIVQGSVLIAMTKVVCLRGFLRTSELNLERIQNFLGSALADTIMHYRSGTANSNTVNSKFHLIRSFNQDFARFLSFHV